MPFALQDVAVTAAAGVAAGVFLYRMWGARRRGAAKPSCPSCASGNSCAPPPVQTGAPAVHRLTVFPPRREN